MSAYWQMETLQLLVHAVLNTKAGSEFVDQLTRNDVGRAAMKETYKQTLHTHRRTDIVECAMVALGNQQPTSLFL